MAVLLPHHAGQAVSILLYFDHVEAVANGNRYYNAHETTAAEEFAIALLCGDVRVDVSLRYSF